MLFWILFGIAFIGILTCIFIIIDKTTTIAALKEGIKIERNLHHDDLMTLSNYAVKINELESDKEYLQSQLDAALQNNQNAEEALSSRYTALTKNIAAAEEQLTQINEQVTSRTAELNDVAAKINVQFLSLSDLKEQNVAAASTLNDYKDELQRLIKELDDAKEKNRLVILNDSQNELKLFSFELSNKEVTLIKTLAEISSLYPELTKDLATIEWKKIWLPKVQDLANREGLGIRGIYRLVLKSDENVCYVGQAVNIKERWYEHIKKMIGADNKGNEKLYNYRPEDFYWSVLEANPLDLNSSEHYWIEFYGCKEIGLNKKV